MFLKIILTLLIFFTNTNCEKYQTYKQVSIGNNKDYNLLLKVSLDTSKDYELTSFEVVKSQKLYFRFEDKVLKVVDLFKESHQDKFIVSSLNILEKNKKKYYQIELYKSNGESEISHVYSANGTLLIHSESIKGQTKYRFIEKGISKDFLSKAKTLEVRDITYLFAE
jgi:hypothetical protein